MIKRYKNFSQEFLLEKTINESVIYYSPTFRKSLKDISRNNEIASELLNIETKDVKPDITFIDLDKDGYISFITMKNASKIINDLGYQHLEIEKEHDETERRKRIIDEVYNHTRLSDVFKKSRNLLKVGKFVNKVVPGKFKDVEIEKFVNKFKSNLESPGEKFELVDGDDIAYWYRSENYQKQQGQLGNSCMKNRGPKTFEMYTNNPEVCKMLILIENEELLGRALIWKLKSIKAPGQDFPKDLYFMDRQYTIKESDVDKFRNYAIEKGWSFKTNNNHMSLYNITFNEKSFTAEMEVQIKQVSADNYNYDQYPYMDTFRRYNPMTGILYNNDSGDHSGQYLLDDTGGGYSEIEGGIWSEWHSDRIPEDEAVWSDWADSYIHRDSAAHVSNGCSTNHGWYPDDCNDLVYDEWNDITIHIDDSVYSSPYGYHILAENAIEVISDVDYDGEPFVDFDSWYHEDDDDLRHQGDYYKTKWFGRLSDRFSRWGDYRAAVGSLFDINYKDEYILKEFRITEYKVLEPKDDSVDISGIEYLTKLDAKILGYTIDKGNSRKTDKFEYYDDKEDILHLIYRRAESMIKKLKSELDGTDPQLRLRFPGDEEEEIKIRDTKTKLLSDLSEKIGEISGEVFADFNQPEE
jgi:hypothetical protein